MSANKKLSFHSWRKLSAGRRCQSPEHSGAGGRGSEHGAGLLLGAAQSCTSGIDRRSRTERQTPRGNECCKENQPKAEPKREGFSKPASGQNPLSRRPRKSLSIASRMFDCTRGNFVGSIVSGVPAPAYSANVLPALRLLARTFAGSP